MHKPVDHQILHPEQILRLLELLVPVDFEAETTLLINRLHPQIQWMGSKPSHFFVTYFQADRQNVTKGLNPSHFCHLFFGR